MEGTLRCLTLVLVTLVAKGVARRPREGEVRLVGGRYPWEGNVEIYHRRTWGLICDDGWDMRGGDVACRQLGYSGARRVTKVSEFGMPVHGLIWLDDVRCYGDETTPADCYHRSWGRHNCHRRESAGVVCFRPPTTSAPSTTTTSTTRAPTSSPSTPSTSASTSPPSSPAPSSAATSSPLLNRLTNATQGRTTVTNATPTVNTPGKITSRRTTVKNSEEDIQQDEPAGEENQMTRTTPRPGTTEPLPRSYEIRLDGGMHPRVGHVEVTVNGRRGVICGEGWSLLEASVVCKQLGLGYARDATQTSHFGGQEKDKILFDVKCRGTEKDLGECYHAEDRMEEAICRDAAYVAGVVCVDYLPDLVPNVTLLERSYRLDDKTLLNLQCAMEEDCVSKSAYKLKRKYSDWYRYYRRLFRFSSSTHNHGTADFRPFLDQSHWEWHQCHMHYHSMQVFAHYDLLDHHGNRIAEGHKASFCLEDVECLEGVKKRYACRGYAQQGITVGCADIYKHDIDCQWIDMTDVKAGSYIFKMHVNPENKVAELRYDNNAVTCNFEYDTIRVSLRNCKLGSG